MKWQIILDDVEVKTRVGILPEEKIPQRLLVSVALDAHYKSVPMKIKECVDYAAVYEAIQSWSNKTHTDLLEMLAYELAQHVLNTMPLVSRVRVSVAKPDIFASAKKAGVTLELER